MQDLSVDAPDGNCCSFRELVDGLSFRLSFGEHDFHRADISKTIVIEVTVGELSKTHESDERVGLRIHGWTKAGAQRGRDMRLPRV